MLLKSSGQGCPSKLVVKLQLCCPLVFSDGAMFEVCNGKSDVWLTVHRNSVWIRKTN